MLKRIRRRKKSFLHILIILAIVIKPAQSFSKEKTNTNPVKVTADELENIGKDNILIGKGNVVIDYKGYSVSADNVKLNMKTGKGKADGNVKIYDVSTKADFECKKADFNFKSKKGIMHDGKGTFSSEYFITGKRFERIDDDKYKLFDGTLTTCMNGKSPAWMFKAKKAEIQVEKYAHLYHATFWIKKIPVLYLPYLIVPVKTKRATGLLFPYIGSSGKDGMFINSSLFWAINGQSDATFFLDYMTKKGLRPGLEYRYTPDKQTSGTISGSYLKEKDTKTEFWKVNMDHRQKLIRNISNVTILDLTGLNNADKKYSDDTDFRTRRQTDSYTSFTKNRSGSSVQLIARQRKSIEEGREDRFIQLPEISFKKQKSKIAASPLFYDLESSYSYIINKTNTKYLNLQRVDFHPRLSLPLNKFPFFNVTPTLGGRGTFYSVGKDDNANPTGGFFREIYDLDIQIEGPKFAKIFFDSSNKPKIKHLIEPAISYSMIPDIDKRDRERIWFEGTKEGKDFGFDGIDKIVPRNEITYSLLNRVLRKQGENTVEILKFEVKESYKVKRFSAEPLFSNVKFDLDSHILPHLLFNVDGEYNVYNSSLYSFNIEARYTFSDLFNFYIERRYQRRSNTFILGSIAFNMFNSVSVKYLSRYDERSKLFVENDYSVKYTAKCWDVSFDFIDRSVFSGTKREKEYKFFMVFTLKGIGSFGKKR